MTSLPPAAVNTPKENSALCNNHPEDSLGEPASNTPAMPKDLVLRNTSGFL